MSVSFLLDTAMYGNPARHLNLSHQPHLNVYPSAPYPDYSGYHPGPALGNDLHHTGSSWSPGFGPGSREEWPPLYGHGTGHSLPVNGVEVNSIPPVDQALLEREEPQDWMRRAVGPTGNTGERSAPLLTPKPSSAQYWLTSHSFTSSSLHDPKIPRIVVPPWRFFFFNV
ncbi:hypothetical protein PO909_007258 [Leuciscus waleckii]